MLRDLEELLLSIPDSQSRTYMREALLCYHGAAYRAAVVIAVAAGMDDLRRKLQSLALTGGASQPVREAHKVVNNLFQSQDAFEGTLLDQALKIELITPAEESKLRTVLQTRHLCGHPSGHQGSAEEARATIAAIIDLILSQPPVLGMSAVVRLVSRIMRKAFFPGPDTESIKSTCDSEIREVNPALFPALVEGVLGECIKQTALRTSAPEVKWLLSRSKVALENLTAFLAASVTSETLRDEVWKRLDRLIEDEDSEDCCLQILGASDGPGLQGAPQLHRLRALSLVRRSLAAPGARKAAATWLASEALAPREIEELRMASRDFARSHSVHDSEAFFWLPDKESITIYVQRLIDNAGSTSFDAANAAILAMQSLTDTQAEYASTAQKAAYVMAIASHEARTYPAKRAKELMRGGLGPRSSFCAAIQETLSADNESILNTSDKHLVRLLRASGYAEAADAVDAAQASAQTDQVEQPPTGE